MTDPTFFGIYSLYLLVAFLTEGVVSLSSDNLLFNHKDNFIRVTGLNNEMEMIPTCEATKVVGVPPSSIYGIVLKICAEVRVMSFSSPNISWHCVESWYNKRRRNKINRILSSVPEVDERTTMPERLQCVNFEKSVFYLAIAEVV